MLTPIQRYPFEVLLMNQSGSADLVDHVNSVDWRARKAKRTGKLSDAELAKCTENLAR
jgi:mRNA interferase MazF